MVGCDEQDAATVASVKKVTGVDVNDPTSVGQYALGGSVKGNHDQTDALVSGLTHAARRDDLETEGDIYTYYSPPEGGSREMGRDKYREALRFAMDKTSPHALLLGKIGDTYLFEADHLRAQPPNALLGPTQTGERMLAPDRRYREAAKFYKLAADDEPDPARKAHYFAVQANALLQGWQYESACEAANQALRLDPSQSLAKRVMADTHRCGQ